MLLLRLWAVQKLIKEKNQRTSIEHIDSDIDIAIVIDEFKDNIIDEEVEFMMMRKGIDYRIEPHIIRVEDYKKISNPFIQEVVETRIRVA